MRATFAAAFVLALTFTAAVGARPQLAPVAWRSVAEKLPIGSVLKIRTTAGERLTAILFVVDDTGITVKPRTRLPVPARHLPYDRIDDLAPTNDKVSYKAAAGIGAGIGGGLLLWLFWSIAR